MNETPPGEQPWWTIALSRGNSSLIHHPIYRGSRFPMTAPSAASVCSAGARPCVPPERAILQGQQDAALRGRRRGKFALWCSCTRRSSRQTCEAWRSKVMAQVVVPLEVFQRGQFPPVCVKTGRPAELVGQTEAVAATSRAWSLICWLPVVGRLWPAGRRTTGDVPITRAAGGQAVEHRLAHTSNSDSSPKATVR